MHEIYHHPKEGTIFGKLTFTGVILTSRSPCNRRNWFYEVKCICGKVLQVNRGSLLRKNKPQQSCLPCSKKTHGGRFTKLHVCWSNMKQRCENIRGTSYEYYGRIGVRVAKEFQRFEDFQTWALANGYKDGLTIDRIDPNKHYSPDNCQWLTMSDNVKRRHLITNDTP